MDPRFADRTLAVTGGTGALGGRLVEASAGAGAREIRVLPFVNAAFVVIARVRARRNVLRADRSLLYDALNRRLGLARRLVICWTIAARGAVGALLVG